MIFKSCQLSANQPITVRDKWQGQLSSARWLVVKSTLLADAAVHTPKRFELDYETNVGIEGVGWGWGCVCWPMLLYNSFNGRCFVIWVLPRKRTTSIVCIHSCLLNGFYVCVLVGVHTCALWVFAHVNFHHVHACINKSEVVIIYAVLLQPV